MMFLCTRTKQDDRLVTGLKRVSDQPIAMPGNCRELQTGCASRACNRGLPQRRFHRPFSLVELLMVMVIIAILAGLVIGGSSVIQRKSGEAKTKSRLQRIIVALQQYQRDEGYFPPQSPPAQVGTVLGADFANEYLEEGTAAQAYRDAWGNPFYYEAPGSVNTESFDLWSYGYDEEPGFKGEDDDGAGGADNGPAESQADAARQSDDITNWKQM